MRNRFFVTSCRFHVNDKYQFLITGYFRENQIGKTNLIALIGKKRLPCRIEEYEFLNGSMRNSEGMPITKHYYLWVTLPESWREEKSLRIIEYGETEKKQVYQISTDKIEKKLQDLPCAIDKTEIEQGCFWLRGWYLEKDNVKVEFFNQDHKRIDMQIENISRPDICKLFPECEENTIAGFVATYKGDIPQKVVTCFQSSQKEVKHTCILKPTKMEKILSETMVLAQKTKQYYQKNGAQAAIKRIWDKMTSRTEISYKEWYRRNQPSSGNLRSQRKTQFSYAPEISVMISADGSCEADIQKTQESLKGQTYSCWRSFILKKGDMLANKKSEWMAFVKAGDILSPNAFFECVKLMNAYPEVEVIYTDEDKLDYPQKKGHVDPNFKPDFNKDMLCSMNYIGEFFLVKTELCQTVGEMNFEYGNAKKYDYLLRCTEQTDHIKHIPKILYSQKKEIRNRNSKQEEEERLVIQKHCDRMGLQTEILKTAYPGVYRIKYQIDSQPLISIIIPNKDHIEDLDKCLESLMKVNSYQNFECIIVENNSTKEETFAYYEHLSVKFPKAKVVFWEGTGFNYPAINNHGVAEAKGDYLLFLNNDTEIMNADCLEELLGYCMRKDVGAVGARLHYEDGTIQHAGVVVGLGGVAAHVFVDAPGDAAGYANRIVAAQDYSAVTAACMLVKRSVFEEVGGFDPEYAVAFNDVDLCLKIREAGYLVVYNPYAELIHYESKSRGYEDTPEKVERFQSEIQRFHKRWAEILENGDPYYNPNLTLDKTDFSLSVVPRVKE